mmetsp:Transcript_98306/g.277994  ORF Transcript_98306/g.277994 Transcript_98306/m.277994 type:complete len:470 (+) Transcript_98306:89-1498(+)
MGAGASAGGNRVFCHNCGARTPLDSEDATPCCGACGATEGVEVTDSRLPFTASSRGGGSTASGSVPGANAGHPPAWSTSDAGFAASGSGAADGAPLPSVPLAASGSVPASMRVESVTVVALQRPEVEGMLLCVYPNVVARREPSTRAASSAEAEDWEAPLEPACPALVSRLETEPLSSSPDGAGSACVCVICANDIDEIGTPVVTLSCGHTFHDSCIRRWLTRRHTCPTCRLELEVDDAKYLRSIGLAEEADAVEQMEQERRARELEKQATARRRWVESMRRGDPVHFGLACGRCGVTPLVGSCYRCRVCEGYTVCDACHVAMASRSACDSEPEPVCEARRSRLSGEEDDQAKGHVFEKFGPVIGSGASGSHEVPPGHGGVLTVLVRPQHDEANGGSADPGAVLAASGAESGVGEASFAAAEVAFAAVRSLALAPLVGASSRQPQGGGGATGSATGHQPTRGRRRSPTS